MPEWATKVFEVIGVVLIVSTPISAFLSRSARQFHEYALTTPDPDDDKTAKRLVRWTTWLGNLLNGVAGMLPVIRMGLQNRKADESAEKEDRS